MDAVTAVKLVIIAFEFICAVILAGIMCKAMDRHPVRAMLTGAEVLAFMIVAMFPSPVVHQGPGRHRAVAA